MFGLAVLTISTSGSQGSRDDSSGRAIKEMKDANGQGRAAHANDPQIRGLTGKHRASPPAKLRRFT